MPILLIKRFIPNNPFLINWFFPNDAYLDQKIYFKPKGCHSIWISDFHLHCTILQLLNVNTDIFSSYDFKKSCKFILAKLRRKETNWGKRNAYFLCKRWRISLESTSCDKTKKKFFSVISRFSPVFISIHKNMETWCLLLFI